MKKLHVAPGDSGGGSLIQALRQAGRAETVLRCTDDFSSGPISTLDGASRAAAWAPLFEPAEMEALFSEFWASIASSTDRLVVWFGRRSARELAFYLAMADQLG